MLHGASIVTNDLDIAIPTNFDNDLALMRALEPFRPESLDLNSTEFGVWDERPRLGPVTSLTTTVGHLDIIRILLGIDDFEGLIHRSMTFDLAEQQIQVASINDLIKMRKAAGRPKDQPHIKQLLALQKLNTKH